MKRFLDPTILTNGVRYDLGYADLPGGSALTHAFSLDVALSPRHVFVTDVPIMRSRGAEETDAGIGDVSVEYAVVPYQNLERRFTSAVLLFEASMPTGDASRGLGLGTWVLSPGIGLALNVTDLFPIYTIYHYRHSVGGVVPLGGAGAGDGASTRRRTSELDIATVRILPKGFWVLAAANWMVDPDVWRLSLAATGGRALSRQFAWSVSYAEHLAGRRTFDRRWSVALDYLLPW